MDHRLLKDLHETRELFAHIANMDDIDIIFKEMKRIANEEIMNAW